MARRHVGSVLRRIREELELTQEQVAKKAGIEPAYLSQVETGTRKNPRWETVARIARALSVSMEVIAQRGGFGAGARTKNVGSNTIAADVRELQAILDKARLLADQIENEAGE